MQKKQQELHAKYACSGLLSRLHKKIKGKLPPYEMSCRSHDAYYRFKDISRYQADNILLSGVARSGYPMTGFCMWCVVRCFGWWAWRKAGVNNAH